MKRIALGFFLIAASAANAGQDELDQFLNDAIERKARADARMQEKFRAMDEEIARHHEDLDRQYQRTTQDRISEELWIRRGY